MRESTTSPRERARTGRGRVFEPNGRSQPLLPLLLLQERFRLTPRQARVAQLLFVRRTNQEIAALLDIRLNTARRHVEAVLFKLDLRSRWDVEPMLAPLAAERLRQNRHRRN